ncbi:MAG TPA: patatin-like phospholipase family protein [Frankiaceae bacterium]|nr:patatin-like phospholipase family protein [Frankiaceae bacterium]
MTTAFVLSGGGSLGAMQVGMLRTLLRNGIVPDRIYGTSIGSLNGGALALDPTPEGVERLAAMWHTIGEHDVFPLDPKQVARAVLRSLPLLPLGLLRATGALNSAFPIRPVRALLGLVGVTNYLVPSGPRRSLIRTATQGARIEDAVVPFQAMATEVATGRLVPLTSGDALDALMASSAIPGIFPPERIEGRLLMDGGVADNTAVDQAVEDGAETIYVLPTGFACDLPRPPRSALAMLVHGLDVLIEQRLIAASRRQDPRVVLNVVPPLCPLSVLPVDFGHSDEMITRAERSTQQWLRNGRKPVAGLSRALGAHNPPTSIDLDRLATTL